MITMALPTFRSNKILWLQLESLCRQVTNHPWELILCEEISAYYSGVNYLEKYRDRLKKAGCINIKLIPLVEHVPLSKKWSIIANEAQFDYFALVASDNYSHPERIQDSVDKLNEGYEWVDWSYGMFLNVNDFSSAVFENPNPDKTSLFMATKTEFIKKLKGPWPSSGIDGWIRNGNNITKHFKYDYFPDGLHTDGCNQISHKRRTFYSKGKFQAPYFPPIASNEWTSLIPESVAMELKERFIKTKSLFESIPLKGKNLDHTKRPAHLPRLKKSLK